MGRLIEGTWNCTNCDTKKIRARYKNCPNCGAPQGKDTVFEMPDTITYVPEDEAATISRNPDWLCSFCEQLNKDTECNCKGCGASRDDSNENYFKMRAKKIAKERKVEEIEREVLNHNDYETSYERESETDYPEKEEYSTNSYHSSEYQNNLEPMTFVEKTKKNINSFMQNHDKKTIFAGLGITLFSLFALFGLIYLFVPKNDSLNITKTSWERSIAIEEERTVKEDDWTVPSGGRIYNTRSEIHHYDHVVDHYETVTEQKSRQVQTGTETYVSGHRDLGNGYFEEITSTRPIYSTEYYTETHQEPVYRDDPVYQTKYYYEIERWFYNRSVDTLADDKSPYWGEVVLEEKEREGARSESYSITAYNKKEEEKTYTVDYNTWKTINVGDNLNVKVYFGGSIKIIDENGEVINFE